MIENQEGDNCGSSSCYAHIAGTQPSNPNNIEACGSPYNTCDQKQIFLCYMHDSFTFSFSIRKKRMLKIALVDKAFNALAPKINVIAKPNAT